MNIHTRSDAVKTDKNLATTSQHKANRVNLPKQFIPYVAPHSRTPAVSHASGSSGGLRTYSLVPLHLRGETPNSANTNKTSNVKNNSKIADGDKILPDATVKQTRVGRKIHTPARFVQMVHALVAPNATVPRGFLSLPMLSRCTHLGIARAAPPCTSGSASDR